MADFQPYTDHEPMTPDELKLVSRSFGMMESIICRIGDTDLSRGKARIKGGRCFWLKDGCRVEIVISSDGGRIMSASKTPDPTAPPPK